MRLNHLWEGFLVELNRILKKSFGVGLVRAGGEFEVARATVIEKGSCTVVIDGGANSGQWSMRLRKMFPTITIWSFEPLRQPFEQLEINSRHDINWKVRNEGLGESREEVLMHVSSNEGMSSSSKLPTSHLVEFGTVSFALSENTQLVRLDSITELHGQSIYLKLDVQGSEWEAIKGSTSLQESIVAIEVETSFTSMYKGDLTHYEIIPRIIELGFIPFAISPAHRHTDGRCTYMDVILVRPKLLSVHA
jgi:FkbM family methyltransferase